MPVDLSQEKLSPRKEAEIKDFINWLDDHNIEYRYHRNGHMTIYHDGQVFAQVWVTTKRVQFHGDTRIGLNVLKEALLGEASGK